MPHIYLDHCPCSSQDDKHDADCVTRKPEPAPALSTAQARTLGTIEAKEPLTLNRRAERTLEILEGLGLITTETVLRPQLSGTTWVYVCRATAKGRALTRTARAAREEKPLGVSEASKTRGPIIM